MAGRSTESSLMPHSFVASPALQHAQPAPPHPPLPNNTPDPIQAATDLDPDASSSSDSFHLRSLQSNLPIPNPTQPPIVPANNALVQSAVTVTPAVSDHSLVHTNPLRVPSHQPVNEPTHEKDKTVTKTSHPTPPAPVNSGSIPPHVASSGNEPQQIAAPKPVDVETESNPSPEKGIPPKESSHTNQTATPSRPPPDADSLAYRKDDTAVADSGTNNSPESVPLHRPSLQADTQLSEASMSKKSAAESIPAIKADTGMKENEDLSVARSEVHPPTEASGQKREKRPLQVTKTPHSAEQQDNNNARDGPDPKRHKTGHHGEDIVSVGDKSETVPETTTDEMQQPENDKVASAGSHSGAMVLKPLLRTAAAPVGGMLRMLRSSPVVLETNTPVAKNPLAGSPTSQSLETGGRMDVEPKKRKNVSWAPQEKLVDVQYIDTRLELIRSWDPDFEITLPFGPATLQMFKSMSGEQRKAEGSPDVHVAMVGAVGSMDQSTGRKMSAFEAARKKEHDMELERARKAREELKKKLDKMVPVRSWRKPSTIVLPAECRMDADGLERFSLGDEGHQLTTRNPSAQSPSSPPMGLRSTDDALGARDANVRLFPLSDGSVETSDGISSGFENSIRSERRGAGGVTEGYYRAPDNDRKFDGGRNLAQMNPGHDRDGIPSYGMPGHQTRSVDGSVPFDGGMSGFQTKNGHPLPPHAVQHLLSALQSTGLLNQPSNSNPGRNESTQYSGGMNATERESRGDSYRDRHSSSNRIGDSHIHESSANGGRYMDEDRRHMQVPEDGAMGPGPAMGMPNGAMGPPPPPPILGHPGQLPPGFQQGVQPEMMEGFPFPMPPMPPPPMGMHPNMIPLGMGIPMPPMGMPLPFIPPGPIPMSGPNQGMFSSKSGKSSSGRGREVETITRPKIKGSKQRKKCKYFGTKQGCRDGNSCVFAHI